LKLLARAVDCGYKAAIFGFGALCGARSQDWTALFALAAGLQPTTGRRTGQFNRASTDQDLIGIPAGAFGASITGA